MSVKYFTFANFLTPLTRRLNTLHYICQDVFQIGKNTQKREIDQS